MHYQSIIFLFYIYNRIDVDEIIRGSKRELQNKSKKKKITKNLVPLIRKDDNEELFPNFHFNENSSEEEDSFFPVKSSFFRKKKKSEKKKKKIPFLKSSGTKRKKKKKIEKNDDDNINFQNSESKLMGNVDYTISSLLDKYIEIKSPFGKEPEEKLTDDEKEMGEKILSNLEELIQEDKSKLNKKLKEKLEMVPETHSFFPSLLEKNFPKEKNEVPKEVVKKVEGDSKETISKQTVVKKKAPKKVKDQKLKLVGESKIFFDNYNVFEKNNFEFKKDKLSKLYREKVLKPEYSFPRIQHFRRPIFSSDGDTDPSNEMHNKINFLSDVVDRSVTLLCKEYQKILLTANSSNPLVDVNEDSVIIKDILLCCLSLIPKTSIDLNIEKKTMWVKGAEIFFLMQFHLAKPFSISDEEHVDIIAKKYIQYYFENEQILSEILEKKHNNEMRSAEENEKEKIIFLTSDKIKGEKIEQFLLIKTFFRDIKKENQYQTFINNKNILYAINFYINYCNIDTQKYFRYLINFYKDKKINELEYISKYSKSKFGSDIIQKYQKKFKFQKYFTFIADKRWRERVMNKIEETSKKNSEQNNSHVKFNRVEKMMFELKNFIDQIPRKGEKNIDHSERHSERQKDESKKEDVDQKKETMGNQNKEINRVSVIKNPIEEVKKRDLDLINKLSWSQFINLKANKNKEKEVEADQTPSEIFLGKTSHKKGEAKIEINPKNLDHTLGNLRKEFGWNDINSLFRKEHKVYSSPKVERKSRTALDKIEKERMDIEERIKHEEEMLKKIKNSFSKLNELDNKGLKEIEEEEGEEEIEEDELYEINEYIDENDTEQQQKDIREMDEIIKKGNINRGQEKNRNPSFLKEQSNKTKTKMESIVKNDKKKYIFNNLFSLFREEKREYKKREPRKDPNNQEIHLSASKRKRIKKRIIKKSQISVKMKLGSIIEEQGKMEKKLFKKEQEEEKRYRMCLKEAENLLDEFFEKEKFSKEDSEKFYDKTIQQIISQSYQTDEKLVLRRYISLLREITRDETYSRIVINEKQRDEMRRLLDFLQKKIKMKDFERRRSQNRSSKLKKLKEMYDKKKKFTPSQSNKFFAKMKDISLDIHSLPNIRQVFHVFKEVVNSKTKLKFNLEKQNELKKFLGKLQNKLNENSIERVSKKEIIILKDVEKSQRRVFCNPNTKKISVEESKEFLEDVMQITKLKVGKKTHIRRIVSGFLKNKEKLVIEKKNFRKLERILLKLDEDIEKEEMEEMKTIKKKSEKVITEITDEDVYLHIKLLQKKYETTSKFYRSESEEIFSHLINVILPNVRNDENSRCITDFLKDILNKKQSKLKLTNAEEKILKCKLSEISRRLYLRLFLSDKQKNERDELRNLQIEVQKIVEKKNEIVNDEDIEEEDCRRIFETVSKIQKNFDFLSMKSSSELSEMRKITSKLKEIKFFTRQEKEKINVVHKKIFQHFNKKEEIEVKNLDELIRKKEEIKKKEEKELDDLEELIIFTDKDFDFDHRAWSIFQREYVYDYLSRQSKMKRVKSVIPKDSPKPEKEQKEKTKINVFNIVYSLNNIWEDLKYDTKEKFALFQRYNNEPYLSDVEKTRKVYNIWKESSDAILKREMFFKEYLEFEKKNNIEGSEKEIERTKYYVYLSKLGMQCEKLCMEIKEKENLEIKYDGVKYSEKMKNDHDVILFLIEGNELKSTKFVNYEDAMESLKKAP